jgi:hypothetical protein
MLTFFPYRKYNFPDLLFDWWQYVFFKRTAQDAVMAYTGKSFGQDMQGKTPDKLRIS